MDIMQMTNQEILDLAIPTKEYAEVMKSWPKPSVDWNDRKKAISRLRILTSIASEMDAPDPLVAEEHVKAPMRDGHQADLWVFRPKRSTAEGTSPLVVLFHGGGYVMGGPVDMADTARAAARQLGAVVVVPAYRLAPESPFPTCLHDGADSLRWIARNAQARLRADPYEGFVVGGESAGGTMALVLAHQFRDDATRPRITGMWLSAAGARMPHHGATLPDQYKAKYLSRTQPECAENPIYSKELDHLIAVTLDADHASKLHCPGIWPGEQGHKNMPSTYMQLCGRDFNRDEGLIYKDMLEQSGVKTKLDMYKGLPHCFWIPLKSLPEYTQWRKDCVEGFRWLLDN